MKLTSYLISLICSQASIAKAGRLRDLFQPKNPRNAAGSSGAHHIPSPELFRFPDESYNAQAPVNARNPAVITQQASFAHQITAPSLTDTDISAPSLPIVLRRESRPLTMMNENSNVIAVSSPPIMPRRESPPIMPRRESPSIVPSRYNRPSSNVASNDVATSSPPLMPRRESRPTLNAVSNDVAISTVTSSSPATKKSDRSSIVHGVERPRDPGPRYFLGGTISDGIDYEQKLREYQTFHVLERKAREHWQKRAIKHNWTAQESSGQEFQKYLMLKFENDIPVHPERWPISWMKLSHLRDSLQAQQSRLLNSAQLDDAFETLQVQEALEANVLQGKNDDEATGATLSSSLDSTSDNTLKILGVARPKYPGSKELEADTEAGKQYGAELSQEFRAYKELVKQARVEWQKRAIKYYWTASESSEQEFQKYLQLKFEMDIVANPDNWPLSLFKLLELRDSLQSQLLDDAQLQDALEDNSLEEEKDSEEADVDEDDNQESLSEELNEFEEFAQQEDSEQPAYERRLPAQDVHSSRLSRHGHVAAPSTIPVRRQNIVLYNLERPNDPGPVPEFNPKAAMSSPEGQQIKRELLQSDRRMEVNILRDRMLQVTFARYQMGLVSRNQQYSEFNRFKRLESQCKYIWRLKEQSRRQQTRPRLPELSSGLFEKWLQYKYEKVVAKEPDLWPIAFTKLSQSKGRT